MDLSAINESLKNVCKTKELINAFLDMLREDDDKTSNTELLETAVELLNKTEEILTRNPS